MTLLTRTLSRPEPAAAAEEPRSVLTPWLLLLALMGVAASALYYVHSLNDLFGVEQARETSHALAHELRQSSDDLTRMVRTYVVTGDARYKRQFQEILAIRDGKAPRPLGLDRVYWDLVGPDDRRPQTSGPPAALLDLMRESGIHEAEFEILRQSKVASDQLTDTEFTAMSLVESDPSDGARLRAIRMLNDDVYHLAKAAIMGGVAAFQERVSQRTQKDLDAAEAATRNALLLLAMTSLLSAFLLWRLLYAMKVERRLRRLGNDLLESEARFHLMANEIQDYAIILLDPEGRVSSWNAGAERIKGYTEQEILGQPMSVFYSPADIASGLPEMLLQTAEAVGSARDMGWRVRKDGSRFYASVTLTAMHDRAGKHTGYAKITRDMTVEKQAEEALIRAKLAADAANQAKSEFLANMSHEIRTPMNGVVGMTDILLHTRLTDEQRRMAQVIQDSAKVQLGVLNDILDFSKIEADKLELSIEPFSLADLVGKACANFSEHARQKGVNLRHESDPRIPAVLEGDALRVRQVLTNFLSNAIKFSSGQDHPGEAEVRAKLAEEGDGKCWIELSVADNGIGMDAATLARLLQPFTQADASTTRKYGGTGLGLVISARLVEAMGGEIHVDSTPGAGSVFTARLPFARADVAPLAAATDVTELPPSEAPAPSHLILVAEDNDTNQEVIRQQLTALGYACDIAADGRDAFKLWHTGRYALVLSDIHMPRMDGYQLAEAIRAEEARSGHARIPILALTANVLKGEAERCHEVGMDAYLTKPLPLSQLKGELVRWLAAEAADAAPPPPAKRDAEEEEGAPIFDPAMLTKMVGNNPAIHQRLLDKFLASGQEQADRLHTAIAAGDAIAAGQIAHGLKSNARSVGAMRLGNLCERLEHAGKAGDLSALRNLLAAVDSAFAAARQAIHPVPAPQPITKGVSS